MKRHFQAYMGKINSMLSKDSSKSKPKGGLLSPTEGMTKAQKEEQSDIKVVAEFVRGIRAAREGMKK